MSYYPLPNPRVISTTEEKPFEFYLEETSYMETLLSAFCLPLQKVAYAWVVDYARRHNNYLPTKQTVMFSTTSELLECLKDINSDQKVSNEIFQILFTLLPDSGWYVHPTYPLSVSQLP